MGCEQGSGSKAKGAGAGCDERRAEERINGRSGKDGFSVYIQLLDSMPWVKWKGQVDAF